LAERRLRACRADFPADVRPPVRLSQSIRTAEDGLISFQYMIPLAVLTRSYGGEKKTQTDLSGFVEFLCVPLEEEVG